MNISIGTDIINISRIEEILKRRGALFLLRFLHLGEVLSCINVKNSESSKCNKSEDLQSYIKIFCKNKNIKYAKNICHTKNIKNLKKYIKNYDFNFSFTYKMELSEILDYKFSLNDFNIERVATFWAAKESLAKALGSGIGANLSFHDMLICKNYNARPFIFLKKNKKKEFNVKDISISLSHDGGFGIANCIVTHKNAKIKKL